MLIISRQSARADVRVMHSIDSIHEDSYYADLMSNLLVPPNHPHCQYLYLCELHMQNHTKGV